MTENSIMWTTGSTGDGASAYTQAELVNFWLMKTWVAQMTDKGGILLGVEANDLEVTGTATPVSVAAGAAYVYGFPYENTATETVAIPTPSTQTRIDLIVLQADWTAQTVRITRIAGTEGAGAPTLTQTAGSVWEVPLASVSITTGGVITVTDRREFVNPSIEIMTSMLDDNAVTTAKINADAVTNAKIADDQIDSEHYVDGSIDLAHLSADCVDDTKVGNRVPQFYRRKGSDSNNWQPGGNTSYTPGAVRMQGGSISISFSSNSAKTGTLTFTTAFSYSPIVILTVHTVTGIVAMLIANLTDVTASDFDYLVATHDASSQTGTCYLNWLAIGPE